ncbi:hypothetical protein TNCV_683391 [Trichonephila clavipes]|nr:hypothetical protein TNCV_683391 [Trichonephila clavipes]
MTATLTLSESFVSDMDWEDTEVRVEEMEWEPSYVEVSEPMDWEDIPKVRASKRYKVSEPVEFNVTFSGKGYFPTTKKGPFTLRTSAQPFFTGEADIANSAKRESFYL